MGNNTSQFTPAMRQYLEIKQQTWTRLQAGAKEQMNEGRQEKR